MKIGLQVFKFDWEGSPNNIGAKFGEIAAAADEAGFYSLWVMDHYFQMEQVGDPSEPMMEAYTTLGYAAALTKQIKLGALVTGVTYRHPGFLIKAVTGLDVLSGGRAYLGIGAAWYERESHGLGFPFPPLKERFERLEETLQIAHLMWSGEVKPFEGTHYQLAEPINQPPAATQPHPPIMIGGGGEKKTLRFVAKYADACNLFLFAGTDTLKHKLEALKGHCEAEGRDYNEIEKTVLGTANVAEDGAQGIIDTCKQLADLGFSHAIFNLPDYTDLSIISDTFGKTIIPAVEAF